MHSSIQPDYSNYYAQLDYITIRFVGLAAVIALGYVLIKIKIKKIK